MHSISIRMAHDLDRADRCDQGRKGDDAFYDNNSKNISSEFGKFTVDTRLASCMIHRPLFFTDDELFISFECTCLLCMLSWVNINNKKLSITTTVVI